MATSPLNDSRERRRYWAVSPNVKFNKHTVGEWREASVRHGAAFMGWGPDDEENPIGPKFAGAKEGGIKPGDIVLIARRHDNKPEIVGFGVVRGKYTTKLKGFKPPGGQPFGSLRWLRPFQPWSRPPWGLPLIDALRHKAALAQLHPERDVAHRKVCDWMERELNKQPRRTSVRLRDSARSQPKAPRSEASAHNIDLVELHENPQLDYTVRTKHEVKTVKMIEGKLLRGYQDWLNKQHRKLSAAKYRRLRCDGYEDKRKNLIEAKSSIGREHVRMAVGQLLDYSYQGRKKFGNPNMAVLLPTKPHPEVEEWLKHLKISVVWQQGHSFFDNANGQFT